MAASFSIAAAFSGPTWASISTRVFICPPLSCFRTKLRLHVTVLSLLQVLETPKWISFWSSGVSTATFTKNEVHGVSFLATAPVFLAGLAAAFLAGAAAALFLAGCIGSSPFAVARPRGIAQIGQIIISDRAMQAMRLPVPSGLH